MTAGFRTSEPGGGPNDGSIYSFNAERQECRRFKRHLGGSDANTLRDIKLVFFLKPEHVTPVYSLAQKNVPAVQWYDPVTGKCDPAFDEQMRPLPKPLSHMFHIIKFVDKETGLRHADAYKLFDRPVIGYSVFDIKFTSRGGAWFQRHHIGHPVVEIFETRDDLRKKMQDCGVDLMLDPVTGHLAPSLYQRRSKLIPTHP